MEEIEIFLKQKKQTLLAEIEKIEKLLRVIESEGTVMEIVEPEMISTKSVQTNGFHEKSLKKFVTLRDAFRDRMLELKTFSRKNLQEVTKEQTGKSNSSYSVFLSECAHKKLISNLGDGNYQLTPKGIKEFSRR